MTFKHDATQIDSMVVPFRPELPPRQFIRIVNPALCFAEHFWEVLMDIRLPILTQEVVKRDASWFYGYGGYVVAKGHVVRMIRDQIPLEWYLYIDHHWGPFLHIPEEAAEECGTIVSAVPE